MKVNLREVKSPSPRAYYPLAIQMDVEKGMPVSDKSKLDSQVY